MTQALKGNIIEAGSPDSLTVTEQGFLVLHADGSVAGIFSSLPEEFAEAEITDFGDALIFPSFVDMHLHAPQYPMLGTAMDLQLLEWLNRYTFPTEARFADPGYARTIYRQLADDLIRNGTTRVCMFSSLHTDATLILMEELENAGVTGYVGKVNMDRNGLPGVLEETTKESIEETERWLNACCFEHVRPILTPRFSPSCTDELMEALGAMAKERDLPVQSHLSENLNEIAWVQELYPDTTQYWESYQKFGLWKEGTVMAHCVYSDEREREAMKEAGVVVAHCADSNINLASGVAPVRRMLNEGVTVTLGSDIAAGAELPMYQVIAKTIRASKIRRVMDSWETDALTVADAFYLGTSAGHCCFGASPGFTKGDLLHAVVVDDSGLPGGSGEHSVVERLERALYLMSKENIIAVWSAGRRVK